MTNCIKERERVIIFTSNILYPHKYSAVDKSESNDWCTSRSRFHSNGQKEKTKTRSNFGKGARSYKKLKEVLEEDWVLWFHREASRSSGNYRWLLILSLTEPSFILLLYVVFFFLNHRINIIENYVKNLLF